MAREEPRTGMKKQYGTQADVPWRAAGVNRPVRASFALIAAAVTWFRTVTGGMVLERSSS
jgi:hypothetical protein